MKAHLTAAALAASLLFVVCSPAVHGQVAVRGEIVHTMDGPPIHDGVVLMREGRVAAVGPASEVAIPDGFRILEGAVVTPGLVDAHSVVGLAGALNTEHDQDQLDRSEPIQPELRAIDAYNPREELVTWLRERGVTTVHTGHGPGGLISGQTMIVKTIPVLSSAAILDSVAMIAMTLGPDVAANFKENPGTRARGAAMLRKALSDAREHRRQQLQPESDTTSAPAAGLRKDELVRLLEGEVPALVTAHHATEIMTALRLSAEYDFRLVLDGASEAYLLLDEIRAAGVPVILHAPMSRAYGEQTNMTFEAPVILRRAEIPFTLQSGYEGYVPKTRVVLFEAAIAAAYGLSFEEALSSVTMDAARILGVDQRIGSLTPGKDGDVVVFDGNPFEYTSHVCGVVINGEVVSETCR